jgi:hypothetical protein
LSTKRPGKEFWNDGKMEEKECSEIRVSGLEKERRAAALQFKGLRRKVRG